MEKVPLTKARPKENAFTPVWQLVRRIPKGRVMTYGQISDWLGRRLTPRAVGWAMAGCPKGVPWWRVVNARGACSTETILAEPGRQRRLLEREGVRFRPSGTIDLDRWRYLPRRAKTLPRPTKSSPRR